MWDLYRTHHRSVRTREANGRAAENTNVQSTAGKPERPVSLGKRMRVQSWGVEVKLDGVLPQAAGGVPTTRAPPGGGDGKASEQRHLL